LAVKLQLRPEAHNFYDYGHLSMATATLNEAGSPSAVSSREKRPKNCREAYGRRLLQCGSFDKLNKDEGPEKLLW
jgi:hypothetical protein